jgi:hypothetical protein
MVDTKWWMFMFFVWIILTFSFTILAGHTAGMETTPLDKLVSIQFDFASIKNAGGAVYDIATWNFSFLNNGTVIMTILKDLLMGLSIVVILPLMFELARLLLKPFGG